MTATRASKGTQEGRSHQTEPRPFSDYGAIVREALLFAPNACSLKLRGKAFQLEGADIVTDRAVELTCKEIPGP